MLYNFTDVEYSFRNTVPTPNDLKKKEFLLSDKEHKRALSYPLIGVISFYIAINLWKDYSY